MGTQLVRTTVSLPADLLEAADHAVRAGAARSRTALIVAALRHEMDALERAPTDAAFLQMTADQTYLAEALRAASESGVVDWEALQRMDPR